MGAVNAENLSSFGGIATVSLVHSLIPTHWLPFSVVGRAQKWTIYQTLAITALGALLHVLSTSILGFTAVTMAHTIAGEEAVHAIASILLVVLGSSYIILFFTGSRGHGHVHGLPRVHSGNSASSMETMAVLGLVLVPALSPCATTLPVFLAVSNATPLVMGMAVLVLLISTMSVMLTLVALSFIGASQVKFTWLERYDKLVVGVVLVVVGVLTHVFHHHDHDHEGPHHVH